MTEPKGSPAKQRPRRRRFSRLLLFLAAILAALFFAEVALRISGFTYFNPYIVDEDVGYSLRPTAEGWWKREGVTYVKINSQGFHDREHSLAKPAATFRIAVIGDSFTEAFQVRLEKSFGAVMVRKLNECPRANISKVEVLSFGISGFSTARELILLQKHVWQYSPDVVVLQVTTGNDIRDNSRTLNAYPGQPVPYFVFQDSKLKLDDSMLAARNRTITFRLQRSLLGRSFNWVQNHSRLLGLIYTAREAYQASSQVPERMRHLTTQSETGLDSEVYAEPANPEWDDAWRVTEGLIVEMRDEVRAKGAQFLVVTGSMGIQVNPDSNVRESFMNRLGIRSLFYPDQRIKALGEHEGFEVLNLAQPMADYANRNHIFLHGNFETKGRGHWNELGHQLVGELIAQELCKRENR
jgi:lysophospholipase L1-like esterase